MIANCLSTSQRYASLHEVAGRLAEFCQAMYPLLVAHADDSGRQAGDVFTIKHVVVPTSPRQISDVEKALTSLARVGLIDWYEVEGRKVVQISDFAAHQPGLKNRGNSKLPALPGDAAKVTACREMPPEGKGTEGKGTEEKRREPAADGAAVLPPLLEVPKDSDPSAPECKVEAVVQLWNEMTVGTPLPQCRGLSDTRRKHITARMKERGLGVIRDTIAKAISSRFCTGENDRGWVLTFDWLMESPEHFLRVMEGKYDNRGSPPRVTGTDGRGRTGAPPPGKYDGIEEQG
jgi:hypothetical protein